MKENFPNESKNKWTRIFKKKWFFPAVYIAIAAFLLSAVVWYQSIESKMMEGLNNPKQTDNVNPNAFDEESQPVTQQEETIKMPVKEEVQTEIVTKFYDYNAAQEDQEKGLNLYNNRYYQSTGVNIAASTGEVFDVTASMSGTVTEVKEDPLYGNVVVISHSDDVSTYYSSLGDVDVDTGAKVKQGDKIGTAGKSLFGEENGTHVYFEIRKDGVEVNPEQFFNEPFSKLKEFEIQEKAETTDDVEKEDTEKVNPEQEKTDTEPETENESDEKNENVSLSFSITA